ncbi:Canalicular multispecific organic anion transporter 1, partial [Coemansia sp. RSA 988]
MSGLLLDCALAYTIVDCLVVALALYLAATSNSGRASTQSVLRALMDNILFMQERQLIRLGKLRDLVFEDVWQLPDRLRLDVVHGELKYNIDEPLFLMRAIIRMIWRPLLPLYAILSLLRILDVVEIVIGSYVLHCLDTPSDHEWYHGYGAAICLLIVKLSKRQRSRVEDYAEMEIDRAIRALELVIFHQPLDSKKGRIIQTRGDCSYEVWSLLHNLQYVLSIGTNVLALVAAFWPVFYKVGWLVIIPPLISIGTMLATWSLEWLTGNRYEWDVDRASRFNRSSVSEIYRGIKSIKLFGWERMYLDPTLLKYYSHTKEIPWYAPVIRAIWTTIDIVEMLASQLSSYLIVHIYTQNSSFALVTFTNSDLFQLGSHISNGRSNLESVCSQLRALRSAVDKNFSIERYLKGRPCNTLSRLEITSILPGPTITMSACTFTWHKKAPNPVLEDISLNILPSELVAVVGKTGSGKSSLLLAICGELEMIKGSGSVTGTIAYLEQSPWIMNDTLRANITFGRDYDSRYFDKVIYACALAEDIAQWPNGDLTVIGERGVNISGGQKARLALARTLYSQADIYILDDPLSAVDAHVKRHILDHVILDTGLLAGKLRIVSTHSNHILPFAHQVVSLDNRTTTVTLQIPRTYCQIVSPPLSPSESTASGGSKSSLSVNVSKDRLPVQSANKLPIKQLKPTDPELRKLGDSYWDNTKYALQICGLPVLVVVLLSSLVKPLTVFVMDGLELNVLRESGIG